MEVTTAVVLAGGAGLRLRPLSDDRPKAMVPVAGRPLLEWILLWLKRNRVRTVIIGVAYQSEKIVHHFRDEYQGLAIKYSEHTVEGGTVEGYKCAIERVDDDRFFAMNGDELMNLRLRDLAEFHNRLSPLATIAVAPMPSPYGVIDLSGEDITGFHEKSIIDSVCVSMGVYVFQHEILKYLPRTGDIERTTFPRLATERKLKAYKYDGWWTNINTVKDLTEAERFMSTLQTIQDS